MNKLCFFIARHKVTGCHTITEIAKNELKTNAKAYGKVIEKLVKESCYKLGCERDMLVYEITEANGVI